MDINPNILIGASPSAFLANVYADNLGPSNGLALPVSDLNPHIIEVNADGLGYLSGSFDGTAVTTVTDVRPKTVTSMTIGATWYIPRFIVEQFNGTIARILCFNQSLSISDRTKVTHILGSTYGIKT